MSLTHPKMSVLSSDYLPLSCYYSKFLYKGSHTLPIMMRFWISCVALCCASVPLFAQPISQLTTADYARAERTLRTHTTPLVFGASVTPRWLPGDQFWYQNRVPGGYEYIAVDPVAGTRTRAFDHERLAESLSQQSDLSYEPLNLPLTALDLTDEAVAFNIETRRYTCDHSTYACTSTFAPQRRNRNQVLSPDGTKAAFIQDHNLWIEDVATGATTQLTTDGIEHYGYATNNAGWRRTDRPVVLWSPDSKQIATFQHDGRDVREMYLTTTNVGHPRLEAWKYPLPGDSAIFQIERVVIDVETRNMVRLNMPSDAHRSTITDHIADRAGNWLDIAWNADADALAFVSVSRDHKQVTLRLANPQTGNVRNVYTETEDTFFESGYRNVNWQVLHDSDEFIWFSQRDDWGHLYLYDLNSGTLKNRITEGAWNVLQVLHVDTDTRTIYFLGAGREGGDPYFQYLYRVQFDGSDLRLLTPERATHEITMAPSGQYFVDTYSTPTTPPITVVRDTDGRIVVELEKADISQLLAAGWQAPEPFQVKARDGETDLYGLMYKPSNFDPAQSYPIINYLYPGPQSGSVGSRAFNPSRGDKQALAELGFIVVEVDAMGTPMRSKSFHEAYYGNMGDNGLPDQITMIQQLAARHPWMDLDRVGIYGHSGGGFASTAGILRYPEFYKVAVSSAGNHDNRNYADPWGEKWHGLLETKADGTTSYDSQANHLLAENLKGKLLLAHGTMDTNVPPFNTLLVVNALIEANKDFDLLMLPNRGHGFSREPYMLRRRWDYFVEHLLGAEPPQEYTFGQLE